jgi:uncharacterized cofD-like protein
MKNTSDLKAVVIGGGSGLSIVLKGLKSVTQNITAIVSVGDDGGSSGIIREDLGILPPGDIRSCIVALADDESEMGKLLSFRFESGMFKDQSLGNLLIAAMCYIKGNFAEAVKAVSDVLKISGTVLPVTLDDMRIEAELVNGEKVIGESCIPIVSYTLSSPIKSISIEPKDAQAFNFCVRAIDEADMIILGPGSLYTSVIPNLLVGGIQNALTKSHAKKFYCCNIMTQRGETDGFTAFAHINALEQHLFDGYKVFDYVLYNTNINPIHSVLKRYEKEGAYVVLPGDIDSYKDKYHLIDGDYLMIKNNYAVHDMDKMMQKILSIVLQG